MTSNPVLPYYLLVAIILGIILWLVDIKPLLLKTILMIAAVISGVLGLVQLLGGAHV